MFQPLSILLRYTVLYVKQKLVYESCNYVSVVCPYQLCVRISCVSVSVVCPYQLCVRISCVSVSVVCTKDVQHH